MLNAHSNFQNNTDNLPLDYDMDGDGRINHKGLIIPTSPIYTERLVVPIGNDPNLLRDAVGDPIDDVDADGDGYSYAVDLDDDNDGMSDEYEASYGTWAGGWQNLCIYNARYAVLIGGGANVEKYNHLAYRNDLIAMNDELENDYRYIRENIYCFSWNLRNGDLDGRVDGPAIWEKDEGIEHTDYATELVIVEGIKIIGKKITRNDLFYFVEITHGLATMELYYHYPGTGPGSGPASKHIYFNALNDVHEANILHYARAVFVMQSCGCGYAMESICGENRIVITAASKSDWDNAVATAPEGELPEDVWTEDASREHWKFLYRNRWKVGWWYEEDPGFILSLGDINNPQSIKHAFSEGYGAASTDRGYGHISHPQLDGNGNGVPGETSDWEIAKHTYL